MSSEHQTTLPDVNDPGVRMARVRMMEACAEMLAKDGNAPNIGCGIDMAGTVFMVPRRRFGIEVEALSDGR